LALPTGLRESDIDRAIRDYLDGRPHPYAPSWRYDLVVGILRMPPKAIVGLAAERRDGRFPRFSGGEEGANRLLRRLGYTVVEKGAADGMGKPADERDWYGRWQPAEPVDGHEVLYHPSVRRWSFQLPVDSHRSFLPSWGQVARAIRSPVEARPGLDQVDAPVEGGRPRRPWSDAEIRATVDAYFGMLLDEQAGVPFVKARVNEGLRRQLDRRSRQAVDSKLANISAILHEESVQPLSGYVPRVNVEQELRAAVLEALDGPAMLRARLASLQLDKLEPTTASLATSDVLIPAPRRGRDRRTHAPVTRQDWVAAASDEARRDLGRRGEEWVCECERAELVKRGHPELAAMVDHVAARVDGLGYDVLSFDAETGDELWIEVKTTNRGDSAPFLISDHELRIWRDSIHKFRLFRVVRFSTEPRLYVLAGDPDVELETRATVYAARPRSHDHGGSSVLAATRRG
jgi:Domain of unknown function (DUF3883)